SYQLTCCLTLSRITFHASRITRHVSRQLFYPLDNASSCEVVGRQLNCYSVAWNDADRTDPKFFAQVAQHGMSVIKLDAPHAVGRRLGHPAFDPDYVFLVCHFGFWTLGFGLWISKSSKIQNPKSKIKS